MAAKAKTPAPLHTRLLDGLTYKSRKDGSVHTVKAGTKVVAEVCVGAKKVRLNFKHELPAAQRKALSGKSKSWAGGGLNLDESNHKVARSLLDLAAQRAQASTGAAA